VESYRILGEPTLRRHPHRARHNRSCCIKLVKWFYPNFATVSRAGFWAFEANPRNRLCLVQDGASVGEGLEAAAHHSRQGEARSKRGKSAWGVYLLDLEQPRPPDAPPGMVKLRLVKTGDSTTIRTCVGKQKGTPFCLCPRMAKTVSSKLCTEKVVPFWRRLYYLNLIQIAKPVNML
jgi:hypothetical protein